MKKLNSFEKLLSAIILWGNVMFVVCTILLADQLTNFGLFFVGVINLLFAVFNYCNLKSISRKDIDEITGYNLCNKIYKVVFDAED